MARIAKREFDTQDIWDDKIARSKSVRDAWKKLFKVDLALSYFDGVQNPGYPDDEWITINKIYSHLKAQLPALYSNDPYFYVKLRRSFDPNPMMISMYEQKGKIRQAMLNYLKEELKLKSTIRLSTQDAHFSFGVAEVEYRAEKVENPTAGDPILSENDNETELLGDDGNPLLEPEQLLANERYAVTRIHPDDFLWDEDAGPLADTWKWVAKCRRITLDEAKADGRYDKRALKFLEGKSETQDDERKKRDERKKGQDVKGPTERSSRKGKDEGKPLETLAIWHIYNIQKRTMLAIAENGEKPVMAEQKYPKSIEDHPFAILRFTLRDDSPYPIPPMSPGLAPQKEYNISRSRLMTHRKRFNRKYEAVEGALVDADTELSKLESGEDGTVIRTNMAGAIKAIADAPLDQQSLIEIGYLNTDMIELLGGTIDEARGIAGSESATAAGILDKRLDMKEGDKLSMVIDFTTDIARKLDMLVQTNITRDEAVKVAGPEGEFWQLVRASDYGEISGEFEYKVNVGATLPRMPQMERASWQAFLALLANFPHLLLSDRLIRKMAEMHHIEDDAMLEELLQIGKGIMSGQMPMPGQSGSQAGVGEDRPVSAVGGQAGGPLSLGMPGAGNT